MLCYRDRTFCPFSESCKLGSECHSALTKEVEEGANRIGLPIAQFVNKPQCYKQKETK